MIAQGASNNNVAMNEIAPQIHNDGRQKAFCHNCSGKGSLQTAIYVITQPHSGYSMQWEHVVTKKYKQDE